jgi:hypothetical protein
MVTSRRDRAPGVRRSQSQPRWPQESRSQVAHHDRDVVRRNTEPPRIHRSRATGHAEEHRLKSNGEMGPIWTLQQFGLAPAMENANPSPGVRRHIDRPLAERADEPLASGHGLEPATPKSAYAADVSEHQAMRGTGGAAAETPNSALVDFPVAIRTQQRVDLNRFPFRRKAERDKCAASRLSTTCAIFQTRPALMARSADAADVHLRDAP